MIDFGGATHDDDNDKSSIINTRQYRGPEVTLQYPQWSFASDIWSIGCIIGEIYQGELLFQTVRKLIFHLISLLELKLIYFSLFSMKKWST